MSLRKWLWAIAALLVGMLYIYRLGIGEMDFQSFMAGVLTISYVNIVLNEFKKGKKEKDKSPEIKEVSPTVAQVELKDEKTHKNTKLIAGSIAVLLLVGAYYEINSRVDCGGKVSIVTKTFALLGNGRAEYEIGNCYSNQKNYEEAVKWYQKSAESGNHWGQMRLGYSYMEGLGVEKDLSVGAMWTRKAADQGDITAQYNLGVSYNNGQGVPKDEKEAVKWYRKAADQGFGSAIHNLAMCYAKGSGVEKDYAEAMKLFEKASKLGEYKSTANLADMYDEGMGTERNTARALALYKTVAERVPADEAERKDIAKVQFALGKRYYFGEEDTVCDTKEGTRWLIKAMENGHEEACFYVAMAYINEGTLQEDIRKANEQLKSAADKGNTRAKRMIRMMEIY
ncbi:MAG: tetratricopeptide repeat protein [Selenomonadaceae bacterium]|nr:tetratricopeptide repeat protein [Selenomonadaceae bacterium]